MCNAGKVVERTKETYMYVSLAAGDAPAIGLPNPPPGAKKSMQDIFPVSRRAKMVGRSLSSLLLTEMTPATPPKINM
jgi:hypothetical protein